MMFEVVFNQSFEEIFYLTLPVFYVVGMVFLLVGIPFMIYFWKRKIPKAARTLFWSNLRREPPLLLCHDSGRGELTTITERKGEGTVLTRQGKFKILPRWSPKLPYNKMVELAQEKAAQEAAAKGEAAETVGKGKGKDKSSEQKSALPTMDLQHIFDVKFLNEHFILSYEDWIVKRTFLTGLDLPFFVGYTGKLCLLNPEALALYEAGEMMIRTEVATLFNPNKLDGKSEDDAMQPLLLMDPRKIQQIIYDGYDQSQLAAVIQDSEELARLGMGLSSKVKMILAILVIVGVAALALFLLPQLIGGQQQKQTTSQFILGAIKHLLRL